jgi:hypothetical protein
MLGSLLWNTYTMHILSIYLCLTVAMSKESQQKEADGSRTDPRSCPLLAFVLVQRSTFKPVPHFLSKYLGYPFDTFNHPDIGLCDTTVLPACLAMMPVLPLDVQAEILDIYVGLLGDRGGFTDYLRDPALVSRFWLERCRVELFSHFSVAGERPAAEARSFWPQILFFALRPHLAQLITHIYLDHHVVYPRELTLLPDVFPNVHYLKVAAGDPTWFVKHVLGLTARWDVVELKVIPAGIGSPLYDYNDLEWPLVARALPPHAASCQTFDATSVWEEVVLMVSAVAATEIAEVLLELKLNFMQVFHYRSRSFGYRLGRFTQLQKLTLVLCVCEMSYPLLAEHESGLSFYHSINTEHGLTSIVHIGIGTLPSLRSLSFIGTGDHGYLSTDWPIRLIRTLLARSSFPALDEFFITIHLKKHHRHTHFFPLGRFASDPPPDGGDIDLLPPKLAERLSRVVVVLLGAPNIFVYTAPAFIALFGVAGRPDVLQITSQVGTKLVFYN